MALDLHLHTTISDGRLTPGELVRLAHDRGVSTMALTDHDSTDGLPEAIQTGDELGVRVVPGIELSTDVPGASIHVLGLFLDYQQQHFQAMVQKFREARVGRARQMVNELVRLGVPVRTERVLEIAGEGSVGRPHVARALLEAGHVQTMAEAFDRFLAHGKPAYFEGFKLAPTDAVRLIHSAGGFASWAHPFELEGQAWQAFLPLLLQANVDGLEVYYSKEYPAEAVAALLDACETNNLLPTVGSDFHGFQGMDRLPGCVKSPDDLLQRLETRVDRNRSQALAQR